jgi:hypothetical protein
VQPGGAVVGPNARPVRVNVLPSGENSLLIKALWMVPSHYHSAPKAAGRDTRRLASAASGGE